MSRVVRVLLIVSLCFVALTARPGAAAPSRTVAATVSCSPAGHGKSPTVTVKLINHSGALLVISYAHGFTTPAAFAVKLRLADQAKPANVTVADGKSRTVTVPWDDLRAEKTDAGGALVVTNFGALTPVCGKSAATLKLGTKPTSPARLKLESDQIAARTLGQLEAWQAYPALYALLHPDARAELPFSALACWYANQFAAQAVASTTVDSVSFSSWIWPVNGRGYADAATILVTQQISDAAGQHPVTSSEHLVLADGQWRWFFGASRQSLAALPRQCALIAASVPSGAEATSTPTRAATPSAASTPEPAVPSDFGSITLTNYVCPKGMTLSNLDRAKGSLDPSAARWTLSGKPLAKLRTWSDSTQHDGPGRVWAGLPFGEYVVNPAALPAGVVFYAIGGSDNIARQDKGIAVTLGPGEPDIHLNTYLIAPVPPTATPTH
jgi:hypothetical protein